ncbi:MAG: hypothetical protein QF371_09175, partial [Flavobacteriales bacterium]|nr:hypothetical protein [Flavobacteriales bacterium]
MSGLLSDIRNNHARIQRVLLFLVAGVLLVLMLPKEGKFKYEYQKGRPWLHEDLVAPFDFAIRKADADLNEETEQIRDNAKVYLRVDRKAKEKTLETFQTRLIEGLKPDSTRARSLELFDRYFDSGSRIIESIYKNGLLRKTEEFDAFTENRRFFLMDGNVASEIPIIQIFTVQTAYELIEKNAKRTKRV